MSSLAVLSLRREPALALDGGQDGLRLTRRLVAQAARRLNGGGLLVVEGAFGGAMAWVGERCVGVVR